MSHKDKPSDWIAAGTPFVCVYQDDNQKMGLAFDINVYYIWTLNRPVINSEKCFFNNNPGHNDDLSLWLGDSSHIIIYLGQASYDNAHKHYAGVVTGTHSYQFIEFY